MRSAAAVLLDTHHRDAAGQGLGRGEAEGLRPERGKDKRAGRGETPRQGFPVLPAGKERLRVDLPHARRRGALAAEHGLGAKAGGSGSQELGALVELHAPDEQEGVVILDLNRMAVLGVHGIRHKLEARPRGKVSPRDLKACAGDGDRAAQPPRQRRGAVLPPGSRKAPELVSVRAGVAVAFQAIHSQRCPAADLHRRVLENAPFGQKRK